MNITTTISQPFFIESFECFEWLFGRKCPRQLLYRIFQLQYFLQVLEGKSTLIYGQSVDTLNHVDFVLKFGMPNTFNSWFLVTEIHVWMLMVRAMAEREHHEVIRNGIVAALWRDSFERARQLGEHGRIIKTQLNELSQQFQYAIVAYDEGLMTNDKQLASAIWRRFFDSNCDNYELIELMVKYIRLNVSINE